MSEQNNQILPTSLDFKTEGLNLEIRGISHIFSITVVEIALTLETPPGIGDPTKTALAGIASLAAAVKELKRQWVSHFPEYGAEYDGRVIAEIKNTGLLTKDE